MAINFAAANMAGYNNPEIEIVTLILNPTGGNFINPPTYETITEILKRGVVPVLAITDPERTGYYLLPLSFNQDSAGIVTFSCCTQTASIEENDMNFYSVKFIRDNDIPMFKNITFKSSK